MSPRYLIPPAASAHSMHVQYWLSLERLMKKPKRASSKQSPHEDAGHDQSLLTTAALSIGSTLGTLVVKSGIVKPQVLTKHRKATTKKHPAKKAGVKRTMRNKPRSKKTVRKRTSSR
jgi:hypothetical protein